MSALKIPTMKQVVRELAPPVFVRALKSLKARYVDGRGTEAGELARRYIDPAIGSFSQYQEDLLIDILLRAKPVGFYVDVGANDPDILSNTKRFYMRGWRGINIEPNVGLHGKLERERPRDLNLNVGVCSIAGEATFYEMSADTLSSFDRRAALKGGELHGERLIGERTVRVVPLKDVIHEHHEGNEIDFLSVDVEGRDLDVLKSNDWENCRPTLVLVEVASDYGKIVLFLESKGYTLVFCNEVNAILMSSERWKAFPAAPASS
jgi:FkbM family methyltransferase